MTGKLESIEAAMQRACMEESARLRRGFGTLSTFTKLLPVIGLITSLWFAYQAYSALQILHDPGSVAMALTHAKFSTVNCLFGTLVLGAGLAVLKQLADSYDRDLHLVRNEVMRTLIALDAQAPSRQKETL